MLIQRSIYLKEFYWNLVNSIYVCQPTQNIIWNQVQHREILFLDVQFISLLFIFSCTNQNLDRNIWIKLQSKQINNLIFIARPQFAVYYFDIVLFLMHFMYIFDNTLGRKTCWLKFSSFFPLQSNRNSHPKSQCAVSGQIKIRSFSLFSTWSVWSKLANFSSFARIKFK